MKNIILNLLTYLINSVKKEEILFQDFKENKTYRIKSNFSLLLSTRDIEIIELSSQFVVFFDTKAKKTRKLDLEYFNREYKIIDDLGYTKLPKKYEASLSIIERMNKRDRKYLKLKIGSEYIVKRIGYYGYNTTTRINVTNMTASSVEFIDRNDKFGRITLFDRDDFTRMYELLEEIHYNDKKNDNLSQIYKSNDLTKKGISLDSIRKVVIENNKKSSSYTNEQVMASHLPDAIKKIMIDNTNNKDIQPRM